MGKLVQFGFVVALAVALGGCKHDLQGAAVDIPEDPRGIWFVNDPASVATIDHTVWDEFLQRHLHQDPYSDGVNMIDYEHVDREELQGLEAYVRGLSHVRIGDYNRDEQYAYWMNFYNAAIVTMIVEAILVDGQKLSSVLQIRGPGLNVVGPWLKRVGSVYGKAVSFNDIEHYILRVAFIDMELRVHYGINCASMGCPPLAPRAHTAENWRENLAETRHQFINSPHGVKIEDGRLYTSKIYHSWFKDDFGGSDENVLRHLMRYAEPALTEQLEAQTKIDGDHYDWRLNNMSSDTAVSDRR
jgi:hypothetical protein